MHATTIFTAAAALAASAVAAPAARQEPLSVQVSVDTSDIHNPGDVVTITVPLYTLHAEDLDVTKLKIVAGSGRGGVDADNVTCRKYKLVDVPGTVPGSAEFTVANEAYISTNRVGFGTVTCYVTGSPATS